VDKQQTLALCEQFQIRPTKSLGQNFLIQESVSRRIAALADLSSADLVIEIGPGLGALTVELAPAAGKVCAIEIDRHLIPALEHVLAPFPNTTIIHEDALKVSFRQLVEDWQGNGKEDWQGNGKEDWQGNGKEDWQGSVKHAVKSAGSGHIKIAANLPYYITTPLIEKLIVELPQSTVMLLMVQDEAADRLLAKPGSKLYSPLAILAAQYGHGAKSFAVPASAYMPQPHVDSCVVTLTANPSQPPLNWPRYQRFLETCFAQRRKTLLNNLRTVGLTDRQMQAVHVFLADRGYAAGIRAEAVTPADFTALYQICAES